METLLRAGLSNAATATLMALVVAGLSRPLARRPAILHGLWLLVLLKLVTPPFYELRLPWPRQKVEAPRAPEGVEAITLVAVTELESQDDRDGSGEGCLDGLAGCDPDQERSSSTDRDALIRSAIVGLASVDAWRVAGMAWLVGSATVVFVSLRRIRRFQRLLKDGRSGSWVEQDWVDEWNRRLGLRRAPDLWWVPGPISPMIWFIGWRPRLILPQELWKRLDAQQRSTLIAHELAHLRRGDQFVRLLELLATSLYWWHPLVWLIRGPLREVEEQCCDAWVVWALPDSARAYAETLLDTLEFLQRSVRPDPLLGSGLGKAPHLRRRLMMIMTGKSRRLPGLPGKLGLLFVAGTTLPIGASWAQKADEPRVARFVVVQDKVEEDGQTARVNSGLATIVADPASTAETDAAVVVVQVGGSDQPAHKVQASGTLDDVVKQLHAEIAELKVGGGSPEQVKALVGALQAIKEAGKSRTSVMIRDGKGDDHQLRTARVRYLGKVHQDGAGKTSTDAEKIRQEIAKLKVALKASVGELLNAQARLRELGEDPGEAPIVAWSRSNANTRFETRTVVVKKDDRQPVKPEKVETRTVVVKKDDRQPVKPEKVETRTVVVKKDDRQPVKPEQVRVLAAVRPDMTAGPTADRQRLERLEGKLRALQEEVDRLKKASAETLEKK